MTGKIGIVTPRQYCCAGLVGHKHAAGRTSSWVGLGGLEAADRGLHLPVPYGGVRKDIHVQAVLMAPRGAPKEDEN
ncbi:hypothetical protein DPEC_G00041160 [Dallia pectoralis]|uniref:Uncharacterized protein n=1 Tax=Dallia pectoralis TaxID=75939 RepID=A0ACC2HGB0_DALPE|nr:hypothetical protein DPEC_G00041160 [Dallia pectoralis]